MKNTKKWNFVRAMSKVVSKTCCVWKHNLFSTTFAQNFILLCTYLMQIHLTEFDQSKYFDWIMTG